MGINVQVSTEAAFIVLVFVILLTILIALFAFRYFRTRNEPIGREPLGRKPSKANLICYPDSNAQIQQAIKMKSRTRTPPFRSTHHIASKIRPRSFSPVRVSPSQPALFGGKVDAEDAVKVVVTPPTPAKGDGDDEDEIPSVDSCGDDVPVTVQVGLDQSHFA